MAELRAAENHSETAAARMEGECQRAYRILRKDNLLCIRKRKFVVMTDSNHGRKIYPNRARAMILTGMDQLCVADITYIRLRDPNARQPSHLVLVKRE